MAITHTAAPPAWTVRLISELHAADARASALAGGLTPAQLNWQAQPGTWSIGQCLEHLCIANEVYIPAIASALPGQPGGAVEAITPGFFSRWFIRNYIEPSPQTKRARAPKKIAPGASIDARILDRFLKGNAAARELVGRASPLDVNRVRFRNPFVPVLRFTVGTGFEVLSRHQRRHLLQAEGVKGAARFPAA